MFKLIIIAIIQSGFLAVAQYYMKIGVDRVGEYNMSWSFFKSFLNWQLGLSLFLYIVGMIIYMFILKNAIGDVLPWGSHSVREMGRRLFRDAWRWNDSKIV